MSGAAPRILSLDAYFMNEVDTLVNDPDTGRRYVYTVFYKSLQIWIQCGKHTTVTYSSGTQAKTNNYLF